MISKDNAFSRIQKSGSLPTLPAILLKLLEACDKDDTPLLEIGSIISKDPVLSFKVLQLVNSAYYGFRHTFKGIEQAVIFLGANTIKNIAITLSVHQVFEQKRFQSVAKFNINIFWYHSLLSASLAKGIARKTGFSDSDEAYLSGLLHDIGKLLLISTFPKEHETILAETEDQEDTLRAETQLTGVNHCETGAWLIQKWKLSSMLADAIGYHHEPLEKIKESFPLVKIVYLANLLSNNAENYEKLYETAAQLLELSQTDLQDIVDEAIDEVEQIAVNMEIRVQKPLPRDRSIPLEPETPKEKEQEEELQETLTTRIKNISLLSSFLENLAQAEDSKGMILACEKAMGILFNIDKVLFFLTDKDGILLRGHTSAENTLHQASQGLTLTLQNNSSLIVTTYHNMSSAYLRDSSSSEHLADKQILTMLRCHTVFLVPLFTNNSPLGVILLGLPKTVRILKTSDAKLAQVVAQQVGICLQMERMKEQRKAALEAERTAAISMTARKIAHEINNPLGIISNYIMSMKLRLADDEQLNNELTIIDEEMHRISSMISQLDLFSQAPKFSFDIIDVNAVIADIMHLVKSAHPTSSDVVFSFLPDETVPQILTSKDATKQILINLVKNAAEAMPDGGKVTVQTRNPDAEKASGKDGVEIVVADTGPGLPKSVTAKLYSPFITTKQNGHSGLGLSIVNKTITDLGGTISCTSSPADGTTFSIFLPNFSQDKLRIAIKR